MLMKLHLLYRRLHTREKKPALRENVTFLSEFANDEFLNNMGDSSSRRESQG